jgi:predicted RNase H-like HicB family nuclease
MSRELRTYTFTVVVEPADEMWHAYCPTLLAYGAATWGTTREEVLAHIGEIALLRRDHLRGRNRVHA